VSRLAQQRRILVVNGHPDPARERFCSALYDAYEESASEPGWMATRLAVGLLSDIGTCVKAPAPLRDLFEENFVRNPCDDKGGSDKPLRLVSTMGMPAFLYRAMLQCEIDVKGLASSVALPGFRYQHQDFIGSIAPITPEQRGHRLRTMRQTGLRAA
jgi:putative NADPH-quinone reductase